MAPAGKANYKSFEAQYRFVRAMVAAHPDVKWDYKSIVKCFGSDMTEHALNHKFRYLRAHAEIIHHGLKAGFDMKDLPAQPEGNPKTIESIDKKNIAKYFGASTADGIQFQFRSIKQEAKMLKEAADKGQDPMSVRLASMPSGISGASAASTPSRSASRTAASSASRTKTPRTSGRAGKAKKLKSEDDSDSVGGLHDDLGSDGSEVETPTRPRDKILNGRITKPSVITTTNVSARAMSSRAAAQNAAAAIQTAATVANEPSASESEAVLDSDTEIKTEFPNTTSIFADPPAVISPVRPAAVQPSDWSANSHSQSQSQPQSQSQSQSRNADLPVSVTGNNRWIQQIPESSDDNGLLEGEF